MGKKHKNSRSLASRKRVKDVSGAMFENTSFHREASKLNIEPLKAGFDTALPRAFREMQKRIQQVKDAEAGKTVKRYVPHPDMPRPAQPREKMSGKKAKKKGMDEADKDGTVESKGDYAFADSFVRKSKGGGEGQGVAAADAALQRSWHAIFPHDLSLHAPRLAVLDSLRGATQQHKKPLTSQPWCHVSLL